MLLAEIHGTRNESVQRDEDYLTSTVFGELRRVTTPTFWRQFFNRAISTSGETLWLELARNSFELGPCCDFTIKFWPSYQDFGEPDLLLKFIDATGRVLLLIIEVKLYAAKSGTGSDDQLRRYFDLLQDGRQKLLAGTDEYLSGLIYLTHRFSLDELSASVALTHDDRGKRWMFTLQWQDLLEVANECGDEDPFLREVAVFLRRRGYEAFRGFTSPRLGADLAQGDFYKSIYFRATQEVSYQFERDLDGRFYSR
jgi:hypothetical protein